MLKLFLIVLTTSTLTFLNAVPVLAAYLVGQGDGVNQSGLRHRYEIWAQDNNAGYVLRVWRIESYPNGSSQSHGYFRSMGEALDYFDCYYTNKRLPSCPWNYSATKVR